MVRTAITARGLFTLVFVPSRDKLNSQRHSLIILMCEVLSGVCAHFEHAPCTLNGANLKTRFFIIGPTDLKLYARI